ncbi:MAG: type II secretion system protein GspM [Gammaproteobacteria bacterium]|nr:type II secretion system protein GspM [Gammaproteobacteria bacterium]
MIDWRRSVEAVQAAWASRPEQERHKVLAGALVVLPLVFYLALWAPLSARVRALSHAVPRERAALVKMQGEARMLAQLKGRVGHAPTGTALLGFIEQQAQAAGLGVDQLSPRGSHRADLVLGKVAFATVLRFIGAVQAQGIAVERARLAPAGPGLVSGHLTMRALS